MNNKKVKPERASLFCCDRGLSCQRVSFALAPNPRQIPHGQQLLFGEFLLDLFKEIVVGGEDFFRLAVVFLNLSGDGLLLMGQRGLRVLVLRSVKLKAAEAATAYGDRTAAYPAPGKRDR